MMIDRSAPPANEEPPAPETGAEARIIEEGQEPVRIEGPVLGRVVRSHDGMYVITVAGGRLTVATHMHLKLRQRIELRPCPTQDPTEESPRVEVRTVPAGAVAIFNRSERYSKKATRIRPRRKTDSRGPRVASPEPEERPPLRLPILGVDPPHLRAGEDTILRVIETQGNRAVVELTGIRLIVESPSPLSSGQEILCRVIISRPSPVFETLRVLSFPPNDSGGPSRTSLPFHSRLRIEVRERLLPEFPPGTEVAASVIRTDRNHALLAVGPARIRVKVPHSVPWEPGDRLHLRVIRTASRPWIEICPVEIHRDDTARRR